MQHRKMKLIGKAEADVVVAVAGRVVVTVSNATVVCVVVPAATAQQTVRALWVNFPEQMYVLFIGLGLTLQCPAGRLEV